MVTKNRIVSSGTKALATDFNENVLQPLSDLNQTDYDNVDVSTNTTLTTTHTLSIDANAISNYVLIRFGIYARGSNGTGGGPRTCTGSLQIDTVEKFTTTVVGEGGDFGGSVPVNGTGYRNCVFKYVPTTDEKTNGFDIRLQAKIDSTSGGGEAAATYGWEVWGA